MFSWFKRWSMKQRRNQLCDEHELCRVHGTPLTLDHPFARVAICQACWKEKQAQRERDRQFEQEQYTVELKLQELRRQAAAAEVQDLNKKLG